MQAGGRRFDPGHVHHSFQSLVRLLVALSAFAAGGHLTRGNNQGTSKFLALSFHNFGFLGVPCNSLKIPFARPNAGSHLLHFRYFGTELGTSKSVIALRARL